jgi:hypothetical protein
MSFAMRGARIILLKEFAMGWINNSINAFSNWMNAITFAEAGEWETARQMMPAQRNIKKEMSGFCRIFAAVAFAEEGLPKEALRLLERPQLNTDSSEFMKIIGLKGSRLTYGVLTIQRTM